MTYDEIRSLLLKPRLSGELDYDYDHAIKIVLLGNPTCGKESLATRFLRNVFLKDKTHIGVSYGMRTMEAYGARLFVQVWFNTVQKPEELLALRTDLIRNAHIVIACYDVTDGNSLDGLETWIKCYKSYACDGGIQDMHLSSLVVCGTKIDMKESRKIQANRAQEFAEKHEAHAHFETSSKNGRNVELMFESVLQPAATCLIKKQLSEQISDTGAKKVIYNLPSLDKRPPTLFCGLDQTLLCPIL